MKGNTESHVCWKKLMEKNELKKTLIEKAKFYGKEIGAALVSSLAKSEPERALRGRFYRTLLFVCAVFWGTSIAAFIILKMATLLWLAILFTILLFVWIVKIEYEYHNNQLHFLYATCINVDPLLVGKSADYQFSGIDDNGEEQVFFLRKPTSSGFRKNGVYYMCFNDDALEQGYNDENLLFYTLTQMQTKETQQGGKK